MITLERDLPVLTLADDVAGHYYLEDDRGLRYAELNKASGHSMKLRLIPRARYLLMRSDGAEVAELDEPRGAIAVALPFDLKPAAKTERGDEAPPGVFEEPFGPAFVDGFRAKNLAERLELEPKAAPPDAELVTEAPPPNPLRDGLGYAAGGVAFLAAVGTIWQATVASRKADAYFDTYNDREEARLEADSIAARNRAIGLGVAAGVTAVGSTLLFLLWE